MQPTNQVPEPVSPIKDTSPLKVKSNNLLKELRPKALKKRSNYDARLPRKLVEAICAISTNTLIKLESDGIISSEKVRHGGLEMVTYGIKDVQAIFRHKKVSFKKKNEAEVITIFSQKGGVGKSAFTQHLGSMLSLVGKVLVVDLDAQSDATVLFGLEAKYGDIISEEDDLDPTIAELMDWTFEDDQYPDYKRLKFDQVVKNVSDSLDIIPADLELGEINYSLNRYPLKPRTMENGTVDPGQFHMIKEVFDSVKDKYDFILVDCPPNIETCNVSALFAANRIIIPLELEAKSLTTMRRNALFLDKLKSLHSGFQWDKVLIVPNKFRQENIKVRALAAVQERYKDNSEIILSQIVIPNSSIIDKCADWKDPIFVPTTRYGSQAPSAIPQAKEFTNLFWGLMHEILDLELERLIFTGEGEE